MLRELSLEELYYYRSMIREIDNKSYCKNKNCTYRMCKKHWYNRKPNQTILFKDYEYKIGTCKKNVKIEEKGKWQI